MVNISVVDGGGKAVLGPVPVVHSVYTRRVHMTVFP